MPVISNPLPVTHFNAGYRRGFTDALLQMKAGTFDDAPKAINHFCDICAEEYFGTDAKARSLGWELNNGQEFCPSHKD